MHIYNLSEDKIDELQKQIDSKNDELVKMKNQTVETFWNTELDTLDFPTPNRMIIKKKKKKT